jgi:hypothetical protein
MMHRETCSEIWPSVLESKEKWLIYVSCAADNVVRPAKRRRLASFAVEIILTAM